MIQILGACHVKQVIMPRSAHPPEGLGLICALVNSFALRKGHDVITVAVNEKQRHMNLSNSPLRIESMRQDRTNKGNNLPRHTAQGSERRFKDQSSTSSARGQFSSNGCSERFAVQDNPSGRVSASDQLLVSCIRILIKSAFGRSSVALAISAVIENQNGGSSLLHSFGMINAMGHIPSVPMQEQRGIARGWLRKPPGV